MKQSASRRVENENGKKKKKKNQPGEELGKKSGASKRRRVPAHTLAVILVRCFFFFHVMGYVRVCLCVCETVGLCPRSEKESSGSGPRLPPPPPPQIPLTHKHLAEDDLSNYRSEGPIGGVKWGGQPRSPPPAHSWVNKSQRLPHRETMQRLTNKNTSTASSSSSESCTAKGTADS